MKTPWLFTYCTLGRVIDGDSIVLTVDTGFNHSAKVHVRLLGVDTPERGHDTEKWGLAREYTENWLAEAGNISFACVGTDKYGGRWLGTLRNKLGESLSDALIDSGLGKPYDGGKRT